MWFILGYLVLIVVCSNIWAITKKITNDKSKLMLIGGLTGILLTTIIGFRIIAPKMQNLQTKVNELTTKLYESYSLVDSLEQEKK